MRSYRLGGLIALLLIIAGCAGFGGYRDNIRVTVSDIQVMDSSTILEQLYEVTLRIQNRADRPIAIRGGSFDIAINGRAFGSGVTDQEVSVPAFSDAQIKVRMVSTVFGMLRLIQGLQLEDREALEYEISGRFSLQDAFGGLSFHESGEISLPRGPADGA
jgi:LEA14-like dessication related protein